MLFGLGRAEPPARGRRIHLRPPRRGDYAAWSELREESRSFLVPWEPRWTPDHLTEPAFRRRVRWAGRSIEAGGAYPYFIIRNRDDALVGGITIENVRRGPATSASLGYWIGAPYARQGYMSAALELAVSHAFGDLGISRLEAACVPENEASRGLLLRCDFQREGDARALLEINGVWRDHQLYARVAPERKDGAPAS